MPVCLTVASHVVAGHVGNGAAAFALAAMGVEAWPLPTVVLSGHAATPGVRGRRLPGAEIAELTAGLAASGALGRVDACLTGYLGDAGAGAAVADLLLRLRGAAPGARVLVDPVLGDDGRLYLPQAMVAVQRDRLLPLADAAAPNLDELRWLTGRPCTDIAGTVAAARALGPPMVFVTSVAAGDRLGILAVTAGAAALAAAPRRARRFNGAGDVAAALLLAHLLRGRGAAEAAAHTVGALSVLTAAAEAGARDDLPVTATAADWTAAPPAPLRDVG